MGYIETGKATQSPDFLLRVQVACFVAAQQILTEPDDTAGHTQRVALAQQVLADPSRRIQQFVWLAASTATVAKSVKVDTDPAKVKVDAADDVIQTSVAANWDAVAGWSSYR